MPAFSRFSKEGFTLIELLVVISIIALLASVIISNVNEARARARDAQRLQSIREVQKAVELYRDSEGSYLVYPFGYETNGNGNWGAAIQEFVDKGYLPVVPHDPFFPDNPSTGFWYISPPIIDLLRCGGEDSNYVLVFTSEVTDFNLQVWDADATVNPFNTDYCLSG